MKIILTGFMGSGKTTVAQALSKPLHFPVVEMDEEVLERTNCKDMAEVFAKGGEILLREWEITLAKEWKETQNVIISTGGGVVMNRIILDYLKENGGIVFYLHSSFGELSKRITADSTPRPLFRNEQQAKELYDFRLPLYKKYADHFIETNSRSLEEVSQEILEIILKR